MEWEFRKTLQSIESYRTGSTRFMAEIEKGTPGVLKIIVREIQLIFSDPNASVLSKVLAMRFSRDIMILGRPDIIHELRRLVPHMLKVCSYKAQQDDINKGEHYFEDHPQYINGTASQKQNIQKYGTTYYILNIESIYNWGKWIKQDENGNQSDYSKALNNLLDRGIKIYSPFNYYRNSDYEKFKKTYKVQFFQQSVDLQSSMRSEVQSQKSSKNSYRSKDFESAQAIRNNLYTLQYSGSKKLDNLQQLKRNVVSLLQSKYPPTMIYYGKQKADKKWLQNFIIHYNLFTQNKINYEQFTKRVLSQQIQLSQKQFQLVDQNGFKKQKTSAKRQILTSNNNNNGSRNQIPDKNTPDQHLLKQQQIYQQLKDKFKTQINQLNLQIQNQRIMHQRQKSQISSNYENRIKNLKLQIANNIANKTQAAIKQNQELREKVYVLQRSLKASRQNSVGDNNNFILAYDQLKLQNSNLKKLSQRNDRNDDEQRINLIQKIKQLQRELGNKNNQTKILMEKLPSQEEISKKNKIISNLNNQLNIYKNSLRSEREQFQRKYKQLENRLKQSENQAKNLKETNKNLQKKLDLRDIEAVELTEQVRLMRAVNSQSRSYQSPRNKHKILPSEGNSNSNQNQKLILAGANYQQNINFFNQTSKQPTIYHYKKYQILRNNYFKNQKQRFLRFCRCCLKRKDLLIKQNQIQIGIISQPISYNNQVTFILFLTNTSDQQYDDIRIKAQQSKVYQIKILTNFILCLKPNQQQKANIICRSPNYFMNQQYHPIFIQISYRKNNEQQKSINIFLPFLLFKTAQFCKIDKSLPINTNNAINLSFPYSQKMLSQSKYIFSYFPQIQQTSKNKYQCDVYYRDLSMKFRLVLQLFQEKLININLYSIQHQQSKLNNDRIQQQKIIMQDIMAFLQVCFKK